MSEQRARDAMEHLQAAALEVIAAMRAFLDVAEEAVRDPSQVSGALQGFAEAAKLAATMASTGSATRTEQPHANNPFDDDDGDGDGGVTRIRVS